MTEQPRGRFGRTAHDLFVRISTRLLRTRWLVRAPIALYRARLGLLMGSRVLMLEHTGRKSGKRRYVVLEVVAHRDHSQYVVASGFGRRADWFRNVQADPTVRVWRGSRAPQQATAHELGPAQATAVQHSYAALHPISWAAFRPVLESTVGGPIADDTSDLPLVALDVADPREVRD
jgi:deazaflavin-dependent oxidoreductase (nitroreductase family)